MKSNIHLSATLALSLIGFSPVLGQQEAAPEVTGLRTAAAEYLTAYNDRDAKGIADLFTENGEITDLTGEDIISGREAILAHYQERFSEDGLPLAAVEVASVRLVAPNLAIEDGTVHLTPANGIRPTSSMKYTAALVKDDAGKWLIGSTRDLSDVTESSGQLSGLAQDLIGRWSSQISGVQMGLTFDWDTSENYIIGELLTTSPDGTTQTGTMRIGWDGARDTITCWNFDSAGGFSKGDWTRTDAGWNIRTEGTTSTGESRTANQYLSFENADTIIWTVKDRMINGEKLENVVLRAVRKNPTPSADSAAE